MDSLPVHFDCYKYLQDTYIEVSTTTDPRDLKFEAKFIFEDSLKNKYEFYVQGDDEKYVIDRVKF
ncbi:MAG: hypothetical protein HC803_11000 [Saprospiraceae bacterium]|nr:hypothetical protein [Saprospiraceae bacterium]